MGHGDGALGYNGRDGKLSGHGGFGMGCGAWNEPKGGRIIISGRKRLGSFWKGKFHVRQESRPRGELDEVGGRWSISIGQCGPNIEWNRAFSQNTLRCPPWLYPPNHSPRLQYDDESVYRGVGYGHSGKFLIASSTVNFNILQIQQKVERNNVQYGQFTTPPPLPLPSAPHDIIDCSWTCPLYIWPLYKAPCLLKLFLFSYSSFHLLESIKMSNQHTQYVPMRYPLISPRPSH